VHLADFNIAKLLAPIDDPMIDDFRNNLEPLNLLAEQSPGFVWRLQDDHGDATSFDPYGDGLTIVNLAVWETVQDLYHFTYRAPQHLGFLRRRRQFFDPAVEPTLVLWWIPEGTLPTVEDGVERLAHLRANGPSQHAFDFRNRYEPDELPEPV
jgi:Domain of unknown function (DUF3291)